MVISEHEVSQEVLVERLVGRFDQSARQEFKWRIDLAINAGYRHVILNVTEVSFIDSAALGWLVLAQRRFTRIRGQLGLVAPQGFVRDILDLTEISEWIPVYSSEEDAIATLQNLPSVERAQSACRDGEE
jgi:stage II sporulation protein AA (anti-sigma F factor antagonist)